MSTTTESASNDFNLETTSSPPSTHPPEPFKYAVTHVFLPLELPKKDYTLENDLSLARAVCAAAHAYTPHVSGTSEEVRWRRITKMLDNLEASVQSEHLDKDHIASKLRGMQTGDILTFFIRPQNAAIILTKRENFTLCESFEVSPRVDAVEKTAGSLICSYPWSATETPNEVFDNEGFQSELANFLSLPSAVDSDFPCPPRGHPQYITALLTGILRGVSRIADVVGITKRVRDNIGRWPGDIYDFLDDWRRSSLWLLIRVAIQMSVDRSSLGRASYKRFVLYFVCTLARDGYNVNLSSDLLHVMSSKIFRRLNKFGTSAPDWISEMALETCTYLREILDARWKQLNVRPSPFQNPSQDDLVRDTKLSLLHSRGYIRNALTNPSPRPPSTPFHPSHHRRGTLEDFLSSNGSFFDEAYRADLDVTLYDVEQSVEQGIDDWFACVTSVDDACAQLEILMDKYMGSVTKGPFGGSDANPEHASIKFLTMIELFIVLDKLVVKEIPMLADYSPEIPIALLEQLCVRKKTSLHRLSRAYQYLFARQSQSRPGWSVLRNEFTEDSFPVRYYDQSPYLQQLKARIEQDAMKKVASCDGLIRAHDEYQECLPKQQPAQEDAEDSQLPLPTLLSHAKVVVFELQCPSCIRSWRSAVARILGYSGREDAAELTLLADVPDLQPYLVGRQGPPLYFQIHFAYSYPHGFQSQNNPTLCYAVQQFYVDLGGILRKNKLSEWQWPWREAPDLKYCFVDRSLDDDDPRKRLDKCANSTSHTSNDVLSAQADCPADLSLHEFIAFAHLRSGVSLQWLNILQGLRSRTLNLRHRDVHFLLAHAAFQVGPLDLNTGTWIWHQELQDPSFCNVLLDELDNVFMDGAGLIDGVLMSTISLLLTRLLASSPSKEVSERAIALLRRVCRKTFKWVQDLSYDLAMSPTNEERRNLLLDMAATCRSTFDVDHATLLKLFHSAEDVDALLSCAFFIQALRPKYIRDYYSQFLLWRNSRLSLALEDVLRDIILANPSDYGVDLAVAKVFPSYRPGPFRWEPLQYPSVRWLTCRTKAIGDQPLKTVHANLLDGSLRLDGQPLGGLPREIRDNSEFQQIFRDQGVFVTPSDLPGMDFTTPATTSKYKVHFSLQDNDLVLRAQGNQMNEVLELIPSKILEKDLPPRLVDEHVHWLNLSTKTIEIRPLEQLWERSSEDWRIDCTSAVFYLCKGHETLVDIRSPTWAMLSKCFECLDTKINSSSESQAMGILITTSPIDSDKSTSVLRLSVTLPRYGLSFFVNNGGELESHDFKDMVYDENQCIGALFGLENLLILRPKTHLAGTFLPEALIPKRVLIPDGLPRKVGDHEVWIDINSFRAHDKPLYHTYIVDTDLGCLIGNGSLANMGFLGHMHAITSCYRPDPLIGKMGTQTALDFLQSAGCRSIMKLKALGWSSIKHPQINAVQDEIWNRCYWNRGAPEGPVHEAKDDSARERAARRAAHLFPLNVTVPTPMEDCEDMEYLIPESDLELEDIISTAAPAVHSWSINAPTMNTISDWADLWSGANTCADAAASLDDSSVIRLNPDLRLAETLTIMVRNILEKKEEGRQRFQLLFLLPTMAYCAPSHQGAFLSMLIAFAMQTKSCLGNPPVHADCNILDGYRPTEQVLRDHLRRSLIKGHFLRDLEDAVVEHLLKNWPCDTPPTISLDPQVCFWDMTGLTISLQQLFSSCLRNLNLKEHLMHVLAGPGLPTPRCQISPVQYMLNEYDTPLQMTLDQLLSNRLAPELPPRSTLPRDSHQGNKTSENLNDIPALDQLFSSLQTNSAFQREYLALLETSAGVRKKYQTTHSTLAKDLVDTLQKHYAQCRGHYINALGILKRNLGPATDHERVLEQFGHWPPITVDVLLRCLASTSPIHLPERWKKCLISFSLLLLELQRSRRLLRFALDSLEEELLEELENEQCNGWNPEEYPDWLLIQVQGNFLIRRTQAETAIQMISPQSGQNTVMQVNIGEGKSSVIIPIAASALADGQQLVRVIVPKALTVQMFELLVARLGWLTNKPIYHLPFFRAPEYDDMHRVITPRINDVFKLMSQCIAECGILLVQPEHVISLKLMSVEEQIRKGKAEPFPNIQKSIYKHIMTALSLKLLPDDSLVGSIFRWLGQLPNHQKTKDAAHARRHDQHSVDVHGTLDNASKWLRLQKDIHSYARDILDESDEILHPRLQLIYTIGLEQHMDGYPDRWTITQQILRIVKEHAQALSRNHPDSVEYQSGPRGSFPHFRIVRASDVGGRLITLIVQDVMAGRLPNFNFQHISPALHDAIRSFISDEGVLKIPDTAKMVEEHAKRPDQGHLWNGLLLLRGLLTSNILLYALAERRWRVDYGLLPQVRRRYDDDDDDGNVGTTPATMLAIPYRAKDVPAPNTQFGHPDLTIILTCLSYYYAGLTQEQLRVSFQILLDQDDPYQEYSLWVEEHDCESLPDSLRELSEINIRTSEQWDNVIFPNFSRNQAAIDFYLSRVVFPREAKQFLWKLSASSWDLGEKREKLITGFSGTNDGRWLLPMSISQHNLDHQREINARVLAYLLQPENDFYMVTRENGERQTTLELLRSITTQRPEIRILLDVGAQILDLSNRQVAKAWLCIVQAAAGAIYLSKKDELLVLARNGITQPLSSSPLSLQIDSCVIYMDHAHTRGTDLKFPIGSRAAVTLGPKVTKDALVQGCMRMRKLGRGHSVMFFAPLGVDQSIRAAAGKKDPNTRVTTVDILCWAIHETWTDIQQRAPYWAQQGMNHNTRYDAWSRFCNNDLTVEQLSDAWVQPDGRSLADQYAPRETENAQSDLSAVPGMQQRCKDLGVLSLPSAQLEEEQELEVHREREREREVELPPKAEPAEHHLHQDVVTFVRTGVIPPLHSGGAFLPVFTTLEDSSAATREADVWSPLILATADFCNTIKPESTKGTMDQYLRPVQWILSSKTNRGQVLVLLSPFEADCIMPDIRASEHVHLHLYSPRMSQRMKPSDDLRLYSIPPLPSDWTPPWALIDQLNVFAGQLYLRDYTSYLRLCRFLDVPTKESPNDTTMRRNLFNIPGSFEETEITFSDSPLPSVMALLAIRTRGRPFSQTHMGRILQGQILTEKDFETPTSVVSHNV